MTESVTRTDTTDTRDWFSALPAQIRTDVSAKKTPSMFYCEARILANLKIYESLSDTVRITQRYAVKACALYQVLNCIARAGWGADCQSVMEADLAIRSGIAANRISLCSPRLSKDDIAWAAGKGLCIIADSESQIALIDEVLGQLAPHAEFRLGVRVSLPVEATARFHTKLGMETADILASIAKHKTLIPFFVEIHHHGAARETDSAVLTEAAAALALSIDEIESKTGIEFSRINLGGGLEPESILAVNGNSTRQIFDDVLTPLSSCRRWESRTVIVEPGRAIVKDAAIGLGTVINLKKTRHSHLAVIDLSTNVLIPLPLAHFGAQATSGADCGGNLYDVVDGTCSPAGVICKQVSLPSLKESDKIVITNAGGYTWSLAEPFYDYLPDLWWISNEGALSPLVDSAQSRAITQLIWGFR